MLRDEFKDFSTFFFDGDGVLYKEDDLLPGAKVLLSELEKEGKKIYLLTNNSTKTREDYCNKLQKLGINIPKDNIFSSAYLTARVLAERTPKARIYVIGEQGLKRELLAQGLIVLNFDEETNDEDIFSLDFSAVDYVVVGMDRNLTYVKIARAVSILTLNTNSQFIATNTDITFPTPKGVIPGGGAMVKILEVLSHRSVNEIVGKPFPLMFSSALEQSNSTSSTTLMIGDRYETDIIGAKKVGIRTCMVLSGISTIEDVKKLTGSDIPDFTLENVSKILY